MQAGKKILSKRFFHFGNSCLNPETANYPTPPVNSCGLAQEQNFLPKKDIGDGLVMHQRPRSTSYLRFPRLKNSRIRNFKRERLQFYSTYLRITPSMTS